MRRGNLFASDCICLTFEVPVATNPTVRAILSVGKVNVIRWGGGFGESAIDATHPDLLRVTLCFSSSCPGNRDAVCPSERCDT